MGYRYFRLCSHREEEKQCSAFTFSWFQIFTGSYITLLMSGGLYLQPEKLQVQNKSSRVDLYRPQCQLCQITLKRPIHSWEVLQTEFIIISDLLPTLFTEKIPWDAKAFRFFSCELYQGQLKCCFASEVLFCADPYQFSSLKHKKQIFMMLFICD